MSEDGPFKILAAAEAVALEDVFDPAVEALDRAIGLRMHRRGQAMLHAEVGAEAGEIVVASSRGGEGRTGSR